jgi:hypothetical protein
MHLKRYLSVSLVITTFGVSALALASTAASATVGGGSPRQNILFFILDDIGADQLGVSNPVGRAAGTLAKTPTIDAIAAQGVNFTNCWAMPECSPSRVCFFTGRFPTRTGVGAPLIPSQTLAQSQCSPFETTTPTLLNAAGYESVLFGKFHLAHNDFNPYGDSNLVPNSIGFTKFNGTLFGAPPGIDDTLANQIDTKLEARYSCGFPVSGNEPAICACMLQNNECTSGVSALECLAAGGVPLVQPNGDPIADCNSLEAAAAAAKIHWDLWNGYYVWPRTVNWNGAANDEANAAFKFARAHADVDQAEHAIEWINEQRSTTGPWMCTVSFSGDHDPWQQPPAAGVSTAWPAWLPYGCSAQDGIDGPMALAVERTVSDRIIESLDSQIRKVLISTGLGHQVADGSFVIDAPNTLIVVIGDNGSFLNTVKAPFNAIRSKGTIYQTGISVPLVMAGGPTASPGRAVDSMVNCVDLFQLWGEVAGIDVHTAVPAGRKLDCFPMLQYLTTPDAAQVRTYNYAEFTPPHLATEATTGLPNCGPCLLVNGTICTDTFLATQDFCEGQGGTWYGPRTGRDGVTIEGIASCCDLASSSDGASISLILWPNQSTITDGRWKLVSKAAPGETTVPCPYAINPDKPTHAEELYDLALCPFAHVLFGRGIDNANFDMLKETGNPDVDLANNPLARVAYASLKKQLTALQSSLTPCIGDITMDSRVDGADLAAMLNFWGQPSVADLNNDAMTDGIDLGILIAAWGVCNR